MALPRSTVSPFLRTAPRLLAEHINSGHKYVTLKVCERDSVQTTREIEVYKSLNTITARHVGRSLVRSTLDTFEIRRTESTHQCLVHKPMGMSLSDLRELCESRRFDEELLRMTLVHILLALDFLHTTARVIHSGKRSSPNLSSKYIMIVPFLL